MKESDLVRIRSDVEKELKPIEEAYRLRPDDNNRRAYANILFKLGDIWKANYVIAPLVTSTSSNLEDLQIGARTAMLLSDYEQAEALFERLLRVADEGSEAYTMGLKGLVMAHYQTNRYSEAKGLTLPKEEEETGVGTLLTFMRRFEGEPYQVEWWNKERVAHLPIINDFEPPGALPLMKLDINEHSVNFILDTGGDRLYIDKGVFEKVGIRNISRRKARYAYTKGEYVEEPLGVAETVKMGGVSLRNVPVIGAKWKEMGLTSDGVLTTQILRQFLSTVDYRNKELTLRERSATGKAQFIEALGDSDPHQIPFFMAKTHMMFTKGSLNGRSGLNFFVDSGLAASMPLVILDETADFLGIERNPIQMAGRKHYWSPIESYGIGSLIRGPTQALGNVLVEENAYWQFGFIYDALISHQYLRHLGSWTIDFDSMTYYFPRECQVANNQRGLDGGMNLDDPQ